MKSRKHALVGVILAATLASVGCHKHGMRGGSIAPAVLGPDGTVIDEGVVVGPPRSSFVDRHPLLSKPRDVYHNTGHHAIVKAMAATVVGVPAGVVCEVGQILYGCERCLP